MILRLFFKVVLISTPQNMCKHQLGAGGGVKLFKQTKTVKWQVCDLAQCIDFHRVKSQTITVHSHAHSNMHQTRPKIQMVSTLKHSCEKLLPGDIDSVFEL